MPLSFVSSFIKKSFLFYSFQHFRKSLNSLNPSPYFLILSKSSLINNPKRLFLSSLIFHTQVIFFLFWNTQVIFLRTGSGFKGLKVIRFLQKKKTKKDCLKLLNLIVLYLWFLSTTSLLIKHPQFIVAASISHHWVNSFRNSDVSAFSLLRSSCIGQNDSQNPKFTKRHHKHPRALLKQPCHGRRRRKKQPEKRKLSPSTTGNDVREQQAWVATDLLVAEKVDDPGELLQFGVSVYTGRSDGVTVDTSVSSAAVTSASVYAAIGSDWDYGFTHFSCLHAFFFF